MQQYLVCASSPIIKLMCTHKHCWLTFGLYNMAVNVFRVSAITVEIKQMQAECHTECII
jgi:hypothetical protein